MKTCQGKLGSSVDEVTPKSFELEPKWKSSRVGQAILDRVPNVVFLVENGWVLYLELDTKECLWNWGNSYFQKCFFTSESTKIFLCILAKAKPFYHSFPIVILRWVFNLLKVSAVTVVYGKIFCQLFKLPNFFCWKILSLVVINFNAYGKSHCY